MSWNIRRADRDAESQMLKAGSKEIRGHGFGSRGAEQSRGRAAPDD